MHSRHETPDADGVTNVKRVHMATATPRGIILNAGYCKNIRENSQLRRMRLK